MSGIIVLNKNEISAGGGGGRDDLVHSLELFGVGIALGAVVVGSIFGFSSLKKGIKNFFSPDCSARCSGQLKKCLEDNGINKCTADTVECVKGCLGGC